jgi:hypothetical protein
MTRRQPGWDRVTAVGVLVSTGAPIGWSVARQARLVGAGIAGSLKLVSRGGAARLTQPTCGGEFREDMSPSADSPAVTAVPEPVR